MHPSLVIVFLLSLIVASICSQETPIPASQLPPRDYNPHPYIVPALRSYLKSNVVTGFDDDKKTFGIQPKLLKQFQKFVLNTNVIVKLLQLISLCFSTGPIQFPLNDGAAEREQQQKEQEENLLKNIGIKQLLLVPPYGQVSEARRSEKLVRIAANVRVTSELIISFI